MYTYHSPWNIQERQLQSNGDDRLAHQLKEAKRGLKGEELRKRLVETVKMRYDFLNNKLTSMT